VDMRLEVVVLSVCDVDRAKEFYQSLGWRLDADFATGDDFRVVQLTAPGSPCSIIFGTGITTATTGPVEGLHLAVADVEAARAELVAAGVEVSDVFHDAGGVFHHAGTAGRVSGPDPEHRSYASFASFTDPDGNGWWLQEITTRLAGRVDLATTSFGSASELAGALRRAALAHGEHEFRTGEADPNWPDWYASYMVAEQAGTQLPT
jgi:catechol 2,3-dioxygenase-like lactoylglutathione lyase family enzyme